MLIEKWRGEGYYSCVNNDANVNQHISVTLRGIKSLSVSIPFVNSFPCHIALLLLNYFICLLFLIVLVKIHQI